MVMRNALTVLVKGLGRKLQKAGITSGPPICVFTLHQPYSTWARLIAWCDLLLGVRVSPRLYAKAPPRSVGECA